MFAFFVVSYLIILFILSIIVFSSVLNWLFVCIVFLVYWGIVLVYGVYRYIKIRFFVIHDNSKWWLKNILKK